MQDEVDGMPGEDREGEFLPFNRAYAMVATVRRMAGRTISHADCPITAITLSLNDVVAPRNVVNVTRCGIDVVNPWTVCV